MPLSDYAPDNRNANKGTARGQKMIVGSIQRSGLLVIVLLKAFIGAILYSLFLWNKYTLATCTYFRFALMRYHLVNG